MDEAHFKSLSEHIIQNDSVEQFMPNRPLVYQNQRPLQLYNSYVRPPAYIPAPIVRPFPVVVPVPVQNRPNTVILTNRYRNFI